MLHSDWSVAALKANGALPSQGEPCEVADVWTKLDPSKHLAMDPADSSAFRESAPLGCGRLTRAIPAILAIRLSYPRLPDPQGWKRHRYVFTKLRAFEIPYKKLVFFDLDVMIRNSPKCTGGHVPRVLELREDVAVPLPPRLVCGFLIHKVHFHQLPNRFQALDVIAPFKA